MWVHWYPMESEHAVHRLQTRHTQNMHEGLHHIGKLKLIGICKQMQDYVSKLTYFPSILADVNYTVKKIGGLTKKIK